MSTPGPRAKCRALRTAMGADAGSVRLAGAGQAIQVTSMAAVESVVRCVSCAGACVAVIATFDVARAQWLEDAGPPFSRRLCVDAPTRSPRGMADVARHDRGRRRRSR